MSVRDTFHAYLVSKLKGIKTITDKESCYSMTYSGNVAMNKIPYRSYFKLRQKNSK